MEKKAIIQSSAEYFNVEDTVLCGQLFRYKKYGKGYLVFSADKCAYCYNDGKFALIECEENDSEYFKNYFDCERDYSSIVSFAENCGYKSVEESARLGKGIRILNQNKSESIISFLISQNNNIPRIKNIIEKLCAALGEKKNFFGVEYYSFPSIASMSEKDENFYLSVGLGYRASYIKRFAEDVYKGCFDAEALNNLSTPMLKKTLLGVYGIGPKVADCVALFGYHRSDSFPVDTWIEKVYKEDFCGKLTDRKKVSEWFTERFKDYSGYVQQYLFYYKRSLENKNNL